jgi:FkbM family methyltransferase
MAKSAIEIGVRAMGSNRLGQKAYAEIVTNAMNHTRHVQHNGVQLQFTVPNALNEYRAATFATKEPETLEWVDAIGDGAVLWDIGANVGLYSCYAARHRNCRVFAFEPSVFNLELLARNIFLNGLTDRITIVPLPLSDGCTISTLNMSTTDWGGALSAFGQSFGHDGKPLDKVFEFRTIGLSMTDAIELLGVPAPDFVKIDVDGIEHLILKGGGPVLAGVKSVLVEINDTFEEQARDTTHYLSEAGLTLKAKRHAPEFDDPSSHVRHVYNQIWSR